MTDMRPNRGAMMSQILQLFVREFFDQNPLSHLSIMLLRNGRAERLTDLSGSPVSLLLTYSFPSTPAFAMQPACLNMWADTHFHRPTKDTSADKHTERQANNGQTREQMVVVVSVLSSCQTDLQRVRA